MEEQQAAAMPEENLPRALYTTEQDFLGYRLTYHQLDDGRRIIEDTPELRRMMSDMMLNADALLGPEHLRRTP